jgi:hypothetical protein
MNNGEGVGGEANSWFAAYSRNSLAFVDSDALLRLLYSAARTDKMQVMLLRRTVRATLPAIPGSGSFNLKVSFDESELNRPVDCEIQSLLLYSAFTS